MSSRNIILLLFVFYSSSLWQHDNLLLLTVGSFEAFAGNSENRTEELELLGLSSPTFVFQVVPASFHSVDNFADTISPAFWPLRGGGGLNVANGLTQFLSYLSMGGHLCMHISKTISLTYLSYPTRTSSPESSFHWPGNRRKRPNSTVCWKTVSFPGTWYCICFFYFANLSGA